jgi:putative Mn2+ efflux pump MntP
LRRHVADPGPWIVFTLLGFVGAWIAGIILAAALFVPSAGLDRPRAFLSFAIATPFIGWSQSKVLRRWNPHTRIWVIASTLGWGGFFAIEIFQNQDPSVVNQLAGRLVSALAGFSTGSTVSATLLGGAVAGAVTGIALAASSTTSATSATSGRSGTVPGATSKKGA